MKNETYEDFDEEIKFYQKQISKLENILQKLRS
jgi:hypothetical protein